MERKPVSWDELWSVVRYEEGTETQTLFETSDASLAEAYAVFATEVEITKVAFANGFRGDFRKMLFEIEREQGHMTASDYLAAAESISICVLRPAREVDAERKKLESEE